MSTINIDLAADTILNVMIGQQDENEVREVVFDFSGWYTTYGSGTISLAIQRPKDEWPYEGELTVDSTNHKATWEISDTDTAYAGTGQIQLSYKVGDAKKKSVVYRFTCHKSLGALGSVVTPVQIQTFIDEVEEELQTMDGRLDDMDDQIADVKADFYLETGVTKVSFTSGGFIKTNVSTGNTVNFTPDTSSTGYSYAITDCTEGTYCLVNGTGGGSPRLWSFVDEDHKMIQASTSGLTGNNLIIKAPKGTAYIIINSETSKLGKCFVGVIASDIKNIYSILSTAINASSSAASVIPNGSDLDDYIDAGNYIIVSGASAQTIAHTPVNVGGRLTVITLTGSGSPYQLFISGNNVLYTRNYSNSAWSAWKELIDQKSQYFIATSAASAVAIPDNSDLNDYISYGNYVIASSASAETISNLPVVGTGRLIVITTTGSQVVQQWFIGADNNWHIRFYRNQTWGSWKTILDSKSPSFLNLASGVLIPSDSDLNDYTSAGNYVIASSAVAQTIAHTPVKMGGRLTVMALTGSAAPHQIFLSGNDVLYFRGISGGQWTNWKHLTSDSEVEQIILSKGDSASKAAYNAIQALIQTSTYNIAFANAFTSLGLNNYLGNTQNVHPSVLYFQNGFGGHKFWMGYTPYPFSTDGVENPCIAYSDDGYKWENISNNPLDDPGWVGRAYDSDTELVYNSDTGMLECWYRYVGPDTETPRMEYICRQTSADGLTWGAKETMLSNSTGVTVKLLSPSVVIENGKYCMWLVNMYSGGDYDEEHGYGIEYYEAPLNDYTNWTKIRTINFNITDDGIAVKPWHISVLKDGANYVLLMMCRNGTSIENNKCSLFVSTSSDNTNYSTPTKVVEGSIGWDKYMYRASIVKVGNTYRIYYSAGSGGTTTIYNGAIWGIGITESNSLDDFIGIY